MSNDPAFALNHVTDATKPIEINSEPELITKGLSILKAISTYGFGIVKLWDASEASLLKLGTLLGKAQAHPMGNANGVTEVTPSANNTQKKQFFGDNTAEFEPHTDGSFLKGIRQFKDKMYAINPPEFVLLQCVQPATQGGESLAVDMTLIIETIIRKEPELLKILMDPNLVSFKRGNDGTCGEPILKINNLQSGQVRFRFDAIHVHEDFVELFKKFITRYVFNPAFQHQFLLQTNEVAIFDNKRALHGRLPIQDKNAESGRRLRRLWIWDAQANVYSKLKSEPNTESIEDEAKYLCENYLPLNNDGTNSTLKSETGIRIRPELFFKINRRAG